MLMILGEKLYTKFDVDDILSENKKLKQENDELKEKSDKLLQNFFDFVSFSRKIGTVPNIVLMDGNGAYVKTVREATDGDNFCDCDKLRERIEELEKENRSMKAEKRVLRTRCVPGAETFFDNGQYGLIKIEQITDDLECGRLKKQPDEEEDKYKELKNAHTESTGVPIEFAAEVAAKLVFEFFKCKKGD